MLERLLKGAFSYLATFAAALVLAGICRHFLFSPVTVYGESMSPTLANHEKVIVSKVGEFTGLILSFFMHWMKTLIMSKG